jgi:fluoride exporter
MTLAIVVGLAGGIGSASRYLVDGAVQDRTSGSMPFGTLTVNAIGSLVLGVLTGLALYHGLSKAPKAVLGTGFCGGLTTWSTASWETIRLADEGAFGKAAANAIGGLGISVAAAAVGIALVAVF